MEAWGRVCLGARRRQRHVATTHASMVRNLSLRFGAVEHVGLHVANIFLTELACVASVLVLTWLVFGVSMRCPDRKGERNARACERFRWGSGWRELDGLGTKYVCAGLDVLSARRARGDIYVPCLSC